jgi:hypothetical protein
LEKGADVNCKNNYGISAKELANNIANYDVKKYIIIINIMEYGHTAHNRSVYAAPPYGGLGYKKTQSAYGLCGVFLRHIFAVAGNLRFPLSQLQKRHIQPERYVQFAPKLLYRNIDKIIVE